MNGPITKLLKTMPEAERESHMIKEATFRGCCGEQVYLQYLARHCNGLLTWLLPEDKKYRIDVIDVWNMTRETVMTGTSGAVDVKLPGREGIAVVAVAE